jgi:hypothetical protein
VAELERAVAILFTPRERELIRRALLEAEIQQTQRMWDSKVKEALERDTPTEPPRKGGK